LTAVFLLGAGGRTRRTAAINNEFYQRVKASVRDVETTTRNETEPATPAALITQTQQFKQDITRLTRPSIHHYILIGRNLNALKNKNSLTPAAHALHYSSSHIGFLINLYKFSSFYPKLKRVNIGIYELKTKFKALKRILETDMTQARLNRGSRRRIGANGCGEGCLPPHWVDAPPQDIFKNFVSENSVI